ncbi:unnamed protein product [Linum tenue]|uniref:Uncharacterized protein n=1 Tax=Linum tenue TaxID=586396 RepID=A0AAV0KXP7_9ROSI|nr:unnamed protein product [Linum tenue]
MSDGFPTVLCFPVGNKILDPVRRQGRWLLMLTRHSIKRSFVNPKQWWNKKLSTTLTSPGGLSLVTWITTTVVEEDKTSKPSQETSGARKMALDDEEQVLEKH